MKIKHFMIASMFAAGVILAGAETSSPLWYVYNLAGVPLVIGAAILMMEG